jgi:hypothetical protein
VIRRSATGAPAPGAGHRPRPPGAPRRGLTDPEQRARGASTPWPATCGRADVDLPARAGLGATHQTGWTALVADVVRRRHGAVPTIADLLARLRDAERAR